MSDESDEEACAMPSISENSVDTTEIIRNDEFEWDYYGEIDNHRVVEKRDRSGSTDEGEENGFETMRRKKKKTVRTSCRDLQHTMNTDNLVDRSDEIYEVSITSTLMLPKQMAMARLLRSENLQNILRIKYKNPFKVLISFEKKIDAEKLINNKKFQELDYRCQLTQEVSLSYGIVKYVDLDMDEKEIMETFSCNYEIISVRRLKRANNEGQWIPSETVRFVFKTSTLPSYVYGYGCRFEVESYVFPVTQCGKCWKYGHYSRTCPSKIVVCPKCGSNHENCEIKEYVCVNCRGPHMALEKTCPCFIKEKIIREIMSSQNITYKKALSFYLKSEELESVESFEMKETENIFEPLNIQSDNIKEDNNTSYRDVLVNGESLPTLTTKYNKGNKTNSKKEKKKINNKSVTKQSTELRQIKENRTETTQKAAEIKSTEPRKRMELKNLLQRLKQVLVTESSFQDKIFDAVKIIFEVVRDTIIEAVKSGDVVNKLINLVIN